MNILIAANSRFLRPARVMLYSLFTAHRGVHTDVWLVHHGLTAEELRSLNGFVSGFEGAVLHVIDAGGELASRVKAYGPFTVEIFYRILAIDLLPADMDRILYLDVDTIVQRDLSGLYETNIEGHPFAVCEDISSRLNGTAAGLKARIGLGSEHRYFNSGVMLFNLRYLREHGAEQRMLDAVYAKYDVYPYPDQDVMNELYADELVWADWRMYNCHPGAYYERRSDALSTTTGECVAARAEDGALKAADDSSLREYATYGELRTLPAQEIAEQFENVTEQICRDACILHYVGASKPWNADYDEGVFYRCFGEIYRSFEQRAGEGDLLALAERILADESLTGSLPRADLNGVLKDCVRILNSDASNRLKEAYMSIMYRAAFRDDMSLEECWQIFRDIDRAQFVNHALKLRSGSLRELYTLIAGFVSSMMDYSDKPFRPVGERNGRLIVVMTSQFLKIGHAPTRRVLDYSYALQHDLGYRVIIINDAGMHYYHSDSMGEDISFTFLDEYTAQTSVEHRGERFEFLQVGTLMPDLEMIAQLTGMIWELNPLMVLNIGATCLTSDMCDPFVTVATLACNTNLPVSTCRNLLLLRGVGDAQSRDDGGGAAWGMADGDERSVPCGAVGTGEQLLPGQRVLETVYNFTYSGSDKVYDPADFLPERLKKAWEPVQAADKQDGAGTGDGLFYAATVGYRIGEELDEPFIAMLDRALEQNPRLCVFVVGEIREDAPIRRIIDRVIDPSCRERLILTGGLQGAGAFTEHMRLVLNPDRSGGGRSIFEACHFGIPVISLRFGDGYYSAGELFGADDYDEYAGLIGRYMNDDGFYEERSRAARARAVSLSDISGTLKDVIARTVM